MSLVSIAECRNRGIGLPADDTSAQDIIDEQEAYLERKIGSLTGSRTETFYVGLSATHGKLGLARYTDTVTLTDGGAAVSDDFFRLIDNGAAVVRTDVAPARWWTGPYVVAVYEPNDEIAVRGVLFDLVALKARPTGSYQSERIGDYGYTRSIPGGQTPESIRAGLASSLLPKRDQLATLYAVSRRLSYGDPVINRPEPAW